MTRLSVINMLKNGGLNLTDLETQIKAISLSWISRILDERVGPWKSYFTFHFKKYGGIRGSPIGFSGSGIFAFLKVGIRDFSGKERRYSGLELGTGHGI